MSGSLLVSTASQFTTLIHDEGSKGQLRIWPDSERFGLHAAPLLQRCCILPVNVAASRTLPTHRLPLVPTEAFPAPWSGFGGLSDALR